MSFGATSSSARPFAGSLNWVGLPGLQLIPTGDPQRPVVPDLPRPEPDSASSPQRMGQAATIRPRVLSATKTVPAVGFSQEGIDEGSSGSETPADVSLAVGRTYLGEAVNAAAAFWRIGAGYSAASIRSLGDFFSTTSTNRHSDFMSDPRVTYDSTSDRWFFVAFDVTRGETDLAVSLSDDPTQSWFIYEFPAAGCPDQPHVAISDTMVAITYNLFADCATRVQPYIGGVIRLFDKAALVAGQAPASGFFGPDPRFISITPVALLSGGSTMFFVSTDYLFSQVIVYTATSVSQPSIPIRRVPVGFLRPVPAPAQAGTSITVDAGDNRVQDAFLLGGNIWLAANDGCIVGGVLTGCVRYEELTPSGQVLDEREEALAAGRSALYPAFRPDAAGNLFSVFGFSSPTDFPGLAADIDPGHASGYTELKDGVAANTSGRWGDYFSASYDPADNTRIWVAGAYGKPGGWGTYIAALATSPFTIPNPTPPLTPPPPMSSRRPVVVSIASAGRVGTRVKLRYRVSNDSERSREIVRIYKEGALVATVRTSMSSISNGSVYYAIWNAPRSAKAAAFCVTSIDPAGVASKASCASLRLSR
jgi:hypothetical protein